MIHEGKVNAPHGAIALQEDGRRNSSAKTLRSGVRWRGEIFGRQALSCPLPGLAMEPDARRCGLEGRHALRQKRADDAGEHIARAGRRKP